MVLGKWLWRRRRGVFALTIQGRNPTGTRTTLPPPVLPPRPYSRMWTEATYNLARPSHSPHPPHPQPAVRTAVPALRRLRAEYPQVRWEVACLGGGWWVIRINT